VTQYGGLKLAKVFIAVPTADTARQAHFYDYFNMIDKPLGTVISSAHGQSPARNRNLMIQQALDNDCSHVLFIDDDTAPPPDILHRLLSRNLDIVSGLYLMRSFPHQPIIFNKTDEDGRCTHSFLEDDKTGLIEVVACGLGAVMIHTRVFKALEQPWIRLGELEKDHWSDDIGFFQRVRKAGFQIYCDLNVKVGHMQQVTLWPVYKDGKWFTSYDTRGTSQVTIPACLGVMA
jgi:hypothetical protein